VAPGGQPRAFGMADLADVDTTGAQAGDVLVYDGTKWVDGADDNGTAVAVALD